MQHPDLTYRTVTDMQTARRERARLSRLLRSARTDSPDTAPQPGPSWLGAFDHCVEEPAAEVVIVVNLQGAVVQRRADLAAHPVADG